jgi:hypothetical protein
MVELGQDAPAERRVVDIVEDVNRLRDPADFRERACQSGGLIFHLKGPHDARRLEMPEFQRAGEADDIRPVLADQRQVDGAFADAVERAVISFPVDPPEPGVAKVGQARAELVAEQPEQAEHRIGVRGGVGHEFDRLQLGLLFEEKGEQHQAVAQGAGDDDAVQAAKLVGQQVVPGHTAGLAEILGVRPGMDGARRGGEAHAVRRGDIAGTPDFDERQRGMGGHDLRTGGRDGFRPDEVLADPGQALPPECWNILPANANRLDADIAGFGDQRGAQAGFEMLYPSLPLAEMGEGFGKAGALHDFQEQIWHASLWHSSLNDRARRAQAFRILQPVEWCDHNAGLARPRSRSADRDCRRPAPRQCGRHHRAASPRRRFRCRHRGNG